MKSFDIFIISGPDREPGRGLLPIVGIVDPSRDLRHGNPCPNRVKSQDCRKKENTVTTTTTANKYFCAKFLPERENKIFDANILFFKLKKLTNSSIVRLSV